MAVSVQIRERVGFHRDVYNSLVKCLMRQRKTGEFCDIVLRVNGRCFHAHRAVLASASPYFRSMFSACMKEMGSEEVDLTRSLQLDNEDSFRMVLDFMYCGDIEINIDNSEDILRIADFLLFEDIKEYCKQFFLVHGNLNLSNCLWLSVLAEHHNLAEVAEVSRSMVKCRFHDYFIQSDEILDLPESIFARLLKDQEVVQFTSVENLISGILRWVQHDVTGRQQSFRRLLSCISLQNVSDECTRQLMQQQYPEIVSQLSTFVKCQIDTACCGSTAVAHRRDNDIEFYDDLFLDETSDQCVIALNCNTAVKFFRFYIFNVPQQQWFILPVHSDTVLHMIPSRLSICSMVLHDAILYMFLSYNLPYPTDMLRINVMAFDIELGELVLLTFQHRYSATGCCQTTLTDNKAVPPAMAHCAGCLCIIGNMEGVGQVFVCDLGTLTYTCYQIQGTRFISLARIVVKDDRYLYIWCRHRFGHEEYCVNKEVTFVVLDVRNGVFVNLVPPPGIGYNEFPESHFLCVENGDVVVHAPGKKSLVLDETRTSWFTYSRALPPFPQYQIPLEMPYRGYELYTYFEDSAYVFSNSAPFITILSCLQAGKTAPKMHTPPPIDGISLVTSGHLLSSYFSALPLCTRFDDSYAKLIHKKSKQLYDTDTEESVNGQSIDGSSKEDGYEYDGFEYDDDIYGYFDDYEYERNIDSL